MVAEHGTGTAMTAPLKVLFINENIGGHATVHHHLRAALTNHRLVEARFLDVAPRTGLRRLAGVRLPVFGPLDLDLQPLRAQLATSAWVRRRLGPLAAWADVIHLYTQNAGLLSVGALARTPSVVSLDTTNAENAYRLPYRRPTRFTPATVALTRAVERRVYLAATTVVANSAWAAQSLSRDYGVSQVRVVPFGITAPPPAGEPSIVASGSDAGTPSRRPTLIFVGRQMARKGGTALLALHRDRFCGRADLVLVTPEPVVCHHGVRVIRDLAPGDPRLWDALRSATVFVFPSEIDQAPNAVLEAMAAGLPVIAVATAAIPEMVLDGETGWLVPPGDEQALAAAIQEALEDPAEARRRGARGRARFEERYNATDTVESLVAVLCEAAGTASSLLSTPRRAGRASESFAATHARSGTAARSKPKP